MPPLWVSPLLDIPGFFCRYLVVAAVIAVVGLAASLIAERFGSYALAPLAIGGDVHLCNFPVAARLVFVVLLAMELVTIAALVLVALSRSRRQHTRTATAVLPSLGWRTGLAALLLLVFLHLGQYAIAFGSDDVCALTGMSVWKHYAALFSFAMLYAGGSIILIGIVMLMLKPALLAK